MFTHDDEAFPPSMDTEENNGSRADGNPQFGRWLHNPSPPLQTTADGTDELGGAAKAGLTAQHMRPIHHGHERKTQLCGLSRGVLATSPRKVNAGSFIGKSFSTQVSPLVSSIAERVRQVNGILRFKRNLYIGRSSTADALLSSRFRA